MSTDIWELKESSEAREAAEIMILKWLHFHWAEKTME